MIRADNILILGVKELDKVTEAMKAYRAKLVTSKKTWCSDAFLDINHSSSSLF